MAQTIVMPKLGLTMTEGRIAMWLKQEGDAVKTGEGLFEVETDKLTNTIEASADGVILKILHVSGDTVPCLTPIAILGVAGENIDNLVNAAGLSSQAPQSQPESIKKPQDEAPTAARAPGGRIVASPAARKFAEEKGVDLSMVTPTGPNRRITLEDVEKVAATGTAVKASPLAAKIAADRGIDLANVPADGRVMSANVLAYANAAQASEQLEEARPMSAMRKVIGKRMRESQDISPTVTFDISVDMTAMKAARAELLAEGVKVSYNDLLAKITARTLLEFPLLNCSVDGDTIILKRYVNLGVAVALPDGLLVPVVKNAHFKGIGEISGEIKTLAEDARKGSLSPDALTGGTFTISNLGMFGIESFTPIINQPEVAILGINAMQDSIVVVDGQPVVRPLMKMSLTADHRAVDGAVAAQFLAKLKKYLEKPCLLLLA
ncbi:MAG: 2-oxo acid dehydrogenase subunit E2 [Planctomycetaceae bacterium]|nr:2-oxo acid dehydrogenase subunit E2 [Planctomycetaceae bacterium]